MSTHAVIFCENSEGTFDGISVNFDGYVFDGGVGELLVTYWTNVKDIKKLCGMKREIRSFGKSFEELDVFDDYNTPICSKSINELKGLTFDQMLNKCGNYDYAYYWGFSNNYEWLLLKSDCTFKSVKGIIEVSRPCH